MLIPRFIAWALFVGLGALNAVGVRGQSYPNKPIRIFTSPAGGGNDFVARFIAQGITGPLGQPVIVENRAPLIALESAVKAPPDGYTMLFQGNVVWLMPLLRGNVSYDVMRDLSPITCAAAAPAIIAAHPSLPVKSVKELIALAKARPGQINFSTAAVGSAAHLAMELFKVMTSTNLTHIPYKGGGGAMIAALTGEVQLTVGNVGPIAPLMKSGKLKGLAITSAQPSALMPGLPTVAASGVPGFESVVWAVAFAPAKTPEAVINRLNQEIVRVLNQPEAKKQLLDYGTEVVASSQAEIVAKIKSEITTMGKVIKDAGIHDE